jgi:hypothetical protein
MEHRITTEQRVMLIAGLAGADCRTVRRYLAGQPVRGATLRERIEEAKRCVDEFHTNVASQTSPTT